MTSEEYIEYQRDVMEAHEMFPEMEMGEAYDKFMLEIKKEQPKPRLRTDDNHIKAVQAAILKTLTRPCTQKGCSGMQLLQDVCTGCAAGKKGFSSVWECQECLYREYSRRPYLDWHKELSKE